MKMKKVGSCHWVIYTLLSNKSLSMSDIQKEIISHFNVWTKPYISQKVKEGVRLGFYKQIDNEFVSVTAACKKPLVAPDYEKIDPEVLFLMRDIDSLEKAVESKLDMFKVGGPTTELHDLKQYVNVSRIEYYKQLLTKLKLILAKERRESLIATIKENIETMEEEECV